MEITNFAVFMVGSMIAGFLLVKSLRAESWKDSLSWLVVGILVNTLIVSLTYPVVKSLWCVSAAWLICYSVMRYKQWGRT